MKLPKWGDRNMKRGLKLFVCSLFLCGFLVQRDSLVQKRYGDVDDYLKVRKRLIQAELAMRIDAEIKLGPEEEEANRRLMLLKQEELERTREYFPPHIIFCNPKQDS
jgi:hypothetical protein